MRGTCAAHFIHRVPQFGPAWHKHGTCGIPVSHALGRRMAARAAALRKLTAVSEFRRRRRRGCIPADRPAVRPSNAYDASRAPGVTGTAGRPRPPVAVRGGGGRTECDREEGKNDGANASEPTNGRKPGISR